MSPTSGSRPPQGTAPTLTTIVHPASDIARDATPKGIPHEGKSLEYATPTGVAVGTVWARVQGAGSATKLPAITLWVRARDGFALVARVGGVWTLLPVPDKLNTEGIVLATGHIPAEPVRAVPLW